MTIYISYYIIRNKIFFGVFRFILKFGKVVYEISLKVFKVWISKVKWYVHSMKNIGLLLQLLKLLK